MSTNVLSVRLEGSPQAVDGLTPEDVLDGINEGIWEPTDEVMGPNDRDWVPIEEHPVFAQAMADWEPPPPKHPEDETRLDMNPLIDVALVLLIFFMLTTTYEELRKEFNPPPGERQDKRGKTDSQIKEIAIRVTVVMENGAPVYRVEGEVVGERDLQTKFEEYINQRGLQRLAMEVAPDVPWKAVVAIQDAAAGAKFQQIIRLVRAPRE